MSDKDLKQTIKTETEWKHICLNDHIYLNDHSTEEFRKKMKQDFDFVNDLILEKITEEKKTDLVKIKDARKDVMECLINIKVIADILTLNKGLEYDSIEELNWQLVDSIDEILSYNIPIVKLFGFRYYSNIKKFSTLKDAKAELINN